MKKLRLILIIFFGFLISCVSNKEPNDLQSSEYYIEKQLSFFDPYEMTFADGKFKGYTYDTWIRQPNNLKTLHETFKKIGYENLVSEYDLTSSPCMMWGYINRPLNQIIDSLILTYPADSIDTKYYREFWQRRKNEANDNIVFKILKEVNEALNNKKSISHNESFVNDTLLNLILIDKSLRHPTKEQALKDFEYLKTVGLHGSAYNLLFENHIYESIKWNKDSLLNQLETSNKKCCPRTWIMDNTK